ncbi:DUF805 domain-containing protein [Bacteroidia bacterium]|jgi:uncharacterized membrane protein YhaH (DUF805 family)|nr:DUF805 domain-containing protein [Bacteroidia bacterium]
MKEKNLWQQYVHVITKNYANFNGRARRKEYWGFFLFNIIISYASAFIFTSIDPTLALVSSIYSLAVFIPSLAVAVRRMHDVGKSGWYILIPIYNIILAVTDGDKSSNEYGEDPKGSGDELDSIGSE